MHVLRLVVVGLVFLVAGSILIVAIGKVREIANRTSCANNMKQIGLSIHNYLDTFGYFSPGAKPKPIMPIEHRLSWIYLVTPFVESSNLYREFDEDKGWDTEENRFTALHRPFLVFQCPSYPDHLPDSKFIPTHYPGISGLGSDAATLPLNDPNAGFFGYERKIKKDDISNGVSNTLAVIETAWATGAWTSAPDSVRGLDPERSPYLGVSGQFGGNHPGGANVLFADGSVKFLENSFDPRLLESMARIAPPGPVAPAN
jgi:prepilin-type processing-associated H-X9-DG protein